MDTKLILAPMLGITDQVFRTSFANFFPGFDEAYAPFIKVNQLGDFKPSKMRELNPRLNLNLKVTPQIMCNHAGAFISVAHQIAEMGYKSLNWNLGCPSPSSSSRHLGCGLLPETELVDRLLNDIFTGLPLFLSIKTRLGLESPHEIMKMTEVFNRYPIEHVIIHPRTGRQGYSGKVDVEAFLQAQATLKMPVYFSGDIKDAKVFWKMRERLPSVKGFLIGRGALQDPLICHKIRNPNLSGIKLNLDRYLNFIEDLWNGYLGQGLSSKDISIKLRTICSYFAAANGFNPKTMRQLRKAKRHWEFCQAFQDDLNTYGQRNLDDEIILFDNEFAPRS